MKLQYTCLKANFCHSLNWTSSSLFLFSNIVNQRSDPYQSISIIRLGINNGLVRSMNVQIKSQIKNSKLYKWQWCCWQHWIGDSFKLLLAEPSRWWLCSLCWWHFHAENDLQHLEIFAIDVNAIEQRLNFSLTKANFKIRHTKNRKQIKTKIRRRTTKRSSWTESERKIGERILIMMWQIMDQKLTEHNFWSINIWQITCSIFVFEGWWISDCKNINCRFMSWVADSRGFCKFHLSMKNSDFCGN